MGLHQGQPAGGIKDLSNCGNTSQVKAILLYPGPVASPTIASGGYFNVGQCNCYQKCPQGCHQPTRSLPHSNHSCLCGGQGGRPHLYGQVKHNGWVLETGRGRQCQMEFRICLAPAPRPALLPSGTHLTSNGVGGITPIFCTAFETA